ncbi:hypothetical protein [Bradyrhizobium sp. SZCCHNRI2010]|uniref:hypothetical protein n=1 Tax=Bradyrhizobium sp. SZCCHNRI2010 TaxID=3057283 RepID=UPI0028EDAB13|nr:hypothetical protein [Bradyrhizobium sp. SZCCHNRI2010]
MGVSVQLIAKAQLAFDSELKCWERHGTWQRGLTQLRRDPVRSMSIADFTPDDPSPALMTIEMVPMPDDEVHDYLFFRAMEKALEAVQADITSAAVNGAEEALDAVQP